MSTGTYILKRRLPMVNLQTGIWGSVVALIFGIIIFIIPTIVNYLIALFLVIFGVIGIIQWIKNKGF